MNYELKVEGTEGHEEIDGVQKPDDVADILEEIAKQIRRGDYGK